VRRVHEARLPRAARAGDDREWATRLLHRDGLHSSVRRVHRRRRAGVGRGVAIEYLRMVRLRR